MSRKTKEHRKRQREIHSKGLSEDDQHEAKKFPVTFVSDDEEIQVRQWNVKKDVEEENDALPVRTAAGQWKASKHKLCVSTKNSKDSDGESDKEDTESSDEEEEPVMLVTKSYDEIKRELATLAIAVTEEGETNAGKLKEMLIYTDTSKYPAEVVRLALLSVLAVIKDILPGYCIRPSGEAEQADKLSKDVQQIRKFEGAVLSSYKRFFAVLKEIIMPKRKQRYSKSQQSVLQMSLTCIHEMMIFASHFNLFEDVLKVAAHALTLPFEDQVLRTAEAFKRLFQMDEQGHVTFLAIRLLSNMIKETEYDCSASWLLALEAVKIRADVAGRRSAVDERKKKAPQHMSTRATKEWKAKQAELRKMAEAEIVVSKEEQTKWNRETLKYLFRVYFGILKKNPQRELLPSVMAGLARHSHRIGVEYFADLLQSLRAILNDEHLELVPALQCILTVDRIYAINENLAAMDLKAFYNALFVQLGRLTDNPGAFDWDEVKLPLQNCLNALFHPKRILPVIRVAAFVQRLADAAISYAGRSMEGPATFMLDGLRTILTHHTRARSVLDREPFGQGTYLLKCTDPDLCNPHTRSLYDVLIRLKNSVEMKGPVGVKESRSGKSSTPKDTKISTVIQEILKLSP
jgi:nucleolar complex protein 3